MGSQIFLIAITAISQEISNMGYRVPRKSGKKKHPDVKTKGKITTLSST
jgi:hypothetical protein